MSAPVPRSLLQVTRRRGQLLATAGLVLVLQGCSSVDTGGPLVAGAGAGEASAADDDGLSASPSESGGLLRAASGGDGDSWHDTKGQEYRLGLINTPETNECFGSEATVERKALTAAGFSADVYTKDTYGRSVAVVRLADGRNLNVQLARDGFANDRYLAQFRDENPQLAQQLDAAFAAARSERRGLWGACSDGQRTAAPVPPASSAAPTSDADCHPDYATCVLVRGDGSGRGRANDLDCGSVPGTVQLRQAGVDPYHLDGDRNGVGCDS